MNRGASLSRRRVLFVSYLFPPVGGVGVHRVTKFVKFLPEFGWDCSVLTVSNPSTPLSDDSLTRDVPPGTAIHRARTWEPGYGLKATVGGAPVASTSLTARLRGLVKRGLRATVNTILQPDAQILWRWNALSLGRRLLAETPHDAIVATGPPFSSLLVGASLSKSSGLPLVLDYRDEWGISNAYWENKQHNALSNRVQRGMQNRALRAARALVATTPSSTRSLQETAREAGSPARAYCLYNGFDPDDFPPQEPDSQRPDYGHGTSLCRLSFVGTLWNLNPIEPFVAGVLQFCQHHPELAAKLELVFAGRRTAEQEHALQSLADAGCRLVTLPFVGHDEAVRLMQHSDALLLINADKPHTHHIINAKTFEYMAARKPIFVVAPQGDLWDVVENLPGTMLCPPGDTGRIAACLKDLVQRRLQGIRIPAWDWCLKRYERKSLAGELSEILNQIVVARHESPETSSSPAVPQNEYEPIGATS